MIHFYETFLSEYNPKLRKSRGVYYTPEPIVNFIVRAVDDVLKDEFDLSNGLANTDKTTIEVNAQGSDKRRSDNQKKRTKEVHKVQILDPAAGTGTFLAEVIRQIHEKFQGQEGIWSSYVEQELIPRLNGFELMMAPYAMCHLKLDMMLRETGYEPTEKEQRLKVFLTNSLEEAEKESDNLFMAKWLSNEAREANVVKRDMPIMVVLGNPPYSVSSSNKGKWIRNLMEDYKKDLDLRNTQPLSDDYIKFIRYSEHFVEQNDQGVVSIVTNNSFLDGIIHKKMREHLLNTFDKIYIYNLNGDVTRSRVSKSKVKDENVFDIQAGVTISVFVKDANSESGHANVLYKNLLGEREDKYNELLENNIGSIDFKEIEAAAPNYFFVPKKFEFKKEYEKGFKIDELFDKSSSGITTSNDKELVSTSKFNKPTNIKYYYRPFDVRYIDYDRSKVKGNRYNRFVKYLIKDNEFLDNIMLNISKNVTTEEFESILVSDSLIDRKYCDYSRGPHAFPIYIYPEQNEETLLDGQKNRKPNLNEEVIEKIADKIDLKFTPEKTDEENTFAPVDLLDYIYAVLHSPDYRSKYNEFLKIDFPRVPYPENAEEFWAFVEKGSELRSIHLMESDKVDDLITSYPESGDNKVEKYDYEGDEEKGKVWLNDEQYFDGVPKKAWEFYIGGYQPAQKWLKYRKGEKLSPQDILHWQKMIVALNETDRVMGEVNNIKEF
jgi:predicted helicase